MKEYFETRLPFASIISEEFPTLHTNDQKAICPVYNAKKPSDIISSYGTAMDNGKI